MTARIALLWWFASLLLPACAFPSVTVFFVRHAERAGEMGDDPPITPGGRERAELLARMLADAGVRKIFVTEYKRTQETAAPLARKLGISPETIKSGDPAPLVSAIRAVTSGAILVVGHSNTIPPAIAALGGPEVPKIADDEYDNLFVATISGREVTVVRLHYGAPRPPPRVAAVPAPLLARRQR
jgi:phosphohistidine phosphatase SixA